jgi:hypothetical protein
VLVSGQEAGSIAVRPDEGSLWIEHFYLRADCHGRGIGSPPRRNSALAWPPAWPRQRRFAA